MRLSEQACWAQRDGMRVLRDACHMQFHASLSVLMNNGSPCSATCENARGTAAHSGLSKVARRLPGENLQQGTSHAGQR